MSSLSFDFAEVPQVVSNFPRSTDSSLNPNYVFFVSSVFGTLIVLLMLWHNREQYQVAQYTQDEVQLPLLM